MSENYIVINGKKMDLTDEQLKRLGIEVRKNPFERVAKGDVYYMVGEYGDINNLTEDGDYTDQYLYNNVNYFNDEAFANQVVLYQLLYRKLLKFAYNNEFEDTAVWNEAAEHFCVYYDIKNKCFDVNLNCNDKGAHVYFNSRQGAERAIEEVVKPFMKEHPEFVW